MFRTKQNRTEIYYDLSIQAYRQNNIFKHNFFRIEVVKRNKRKFLICSVRFLGIDTEKKQSLSDIKNHYIKALRCLTDNFIDSPTAKGLKVTSLKQPPKTH